MVESKFEAGHENVAIHPEQGNLLVLDNLSNWPVQNGNIELPKVSEINLQDLDEEELVYELSNRLRRSLVADDPEPTPKIPSWMHEPASVTWISESISDDLFEENEPASVSWKDESIADDPEPAPKISSSMNEPASVTCIDESIVEDSIEVKTSPELSEVRTKIVKFFGGAARYARKTSNNLAVKVADAFEARDESSRRPSARAMAGLAAASILVGSIVSSSAPEAHVKKVKTEQEITVYNPAEMDVIRSHMPKAELAPSGPWVPPILKKWEQSVDDLLKGPTFKDYQLIVDTRLIMAVMTPSSLGDPKAVAPDGRANVMQMPADLAQVYVPDYDPKNYTKSVYAGILNLDQREKFVLLAHDYSNDRSGLTRAVIEGPEPGMGYDPNPQNAKALADRAVQIDASWSKATSDEFANLIKDKKARDMLSEATDYGIEQGWLIKVPAK